LFYEQLYIKDNGNKVNFANCKNIFENQQFRKRGEVLKENTLKNIAFFAQFKEILK